MPVMWTFEAIGTQWNIELYGTEAAGIDTTALQAAVQRRIAVFDRDYSRFRSDSLVSAMARQAGMYTLPADAKPLFDVYHQLYLLSDGKMTPLIGRLLADAGYDANYSLQAGRLQRPPAWDDVLDYQFPALTIKQPVLLDFGAAGKGYLVDIIGDMLRLHGVRNFVVDAGGDSLCRTPPGQAARIGLEHPGDPSQAIGVATIANRSLCGSAGNRRRWASFHHIMDPVTLLSPEHIRAVWVVAGTTILADALTTGLYFMTPEVLQPHFDFEYAIVRQDYSLEHSTQFPAVFFTKERLPHAAHHR
ncbi:MAG TPA: FAD:protein FMN transferase [Candidatus Saccharimonadales bacterium]|nr:FAD:protein FMN transferase [Candidatus Saccharimonadales bacterium]